MKNFSKFAFIGLCLAALYYWYTTFPKGNDQDDGSGGGGSGTGGGVTGNHLIESEKDVAASLLSINAGNPDYNALETFATFTGGGKQIKALMRWSAIYPVNGVWKNSFDQTHNGVRMVGRHVYESYDNAQGVPVYTKKNTYLYLFDVSHLQPQAISAQYALKAVAINWITKTFENVK